MSGHGQLTRLDDSLLSSSAGQDAQVDAAETGSAAPSCRSVPLYINAAAVVVSIAALDTYKVVAPRSGTIDRRSLGCVSDHLHLQVCEAEWRAVGVGWV